MNLKTGVRFVGCGDDLESCDIALAGIPFDVTSSFRKGSDKGPAAIREYSDSIETFSPELHEDIEDYNIADIGDVVIEPNTPEKAVEEVEKLADFILEKDKRAVYMGGEHLVSYPLVKAYHKKYPDLKVIYFDAHADLRDHYDGEKLSHASAARRISEVIGEKNLFMFGIRSFEKNEIEFVREKGIFCDNTLIELGNVIDTIGNSPVYISFDVDVFDPSVLSGVGNPEAGGITYKDFVKCLNEFERISNLIGFDVVELSPDYDPSGNSGVFVAKVLREIILMMAANG